VLRETIASGSWLRHVPFLRYLAKQVPTTREPFDKEEAITGCILGTAVGDALGLACEGLSRRRQRRLFPDISGYHLILGKGMTSDDTEHTLMLAQSLIETGGSGPDLLSMKFTRNFAWRLRFWLLGLPAGIGMATLRAIVKLWLGFPGKYSGVWSAGNAPAMRAALIGVCYGQDRDKMSALVRAATRITHTDPKAEAGALAVALAAHLSASRAVPVTPAQYLDELRSLTDIHASGICELVNSVCSSIAASETGEIYAERIGCAHGVTGYVDHTVPVALHVWMRHPRDYRAAVTEVIRLGGDTDTTAAIVGALVGANVGKAGIPPQWLADLWEWPRTVAWMEKVGTKLAKTCAKRESASAVPLNALALLLRNAVFLVIVLLHGFRRLLPPY
jgi:ADP-ribosylglycohydrolase